MKKIRLNSTYALVQDGRSWYLVKRKPIRGGVNDGLTAELRESRYGTLGNAILAYVGKRIGHRNDTLKEFAELFRRMADELEEAGDETSVASEAV